MWQTPPHITNGDGLSALKALYLQLQSIKISPPNTTMLASYLKGRKEDST